MKPWSKNATAEIFRDIVGQILKEIVNIAQALGKKLNIFNFNNKIK
jgi:hypothetical protein